VAILPLGVDLPVGFDFNDPRTKGLSRPTDSRTWVPAGRASGEILGPEALDFLCSRRLGVGRVGTGRSWSAPRRRWSVRRPSGATIEDCGVNRRALRILLVTLGLAAVVYGGANSGGLRRE
jgi:hypothetical protein